MKVDLKWAVGVAVLIFGMGAAWARLEYRLNAIEQAQQFYHGAYDSEWAVNRPAGAK
ncbi:MAG: hypothetical protein WAY02_07370 [Burkholderiaceae bacterium]